MLRSIDRITDVQTNGHGTCGKESQRKFALANKRFGSRLLLVKNPIEIVLVGLEVQGIEEVALHELIDTSEVLAPGDRYWKESATRLVAPPEEQCNGSVRRCDLLQQTANALCKVFFDRPLCCCHLSITCEYSLNNSFNGAIARVMRG